MSHQPDRFDYLYRQYSNRSCTHDEMQELFEYVSDPAYRHRLEAIADEHLEALQMPERLPEIDWEYMYNNIIPQGGRVISMDHERESPNVRFLWRKIAVAAAILLVLSAGGYWWLSRTPKTEVASKDIPTVEQRIAAAGHNKAFLTLGDHSAIMLDSAVNGKLAEQGSTTIIKSGDGKLVYDTKSLTIDHSPLTNTLTTPRGGQYHLILPDGSKVWLNAASSIRYPTAFTGNERIVEVKGEAYFEVAKVSTEAGGKKPFQVYISSTSGIRKGVVEVLGTHFNINAYDDEVAVKTTLLEGKVSVTASEEPQTTNYKPQTILLPGQQAQLSNAGSIKVQDNADVGAAIAWKNGVFAFKGSDIKTVMRQIIRWYDVQVVYEEELKENFYVEINRNSEIADVLKILENTGGGHFRMEGKRVIVTK
jgi:transmembrane sensor